MFSLYPEVPRETPDPGGQGSRGSWGVSRETPKSCWGQGSPGLFEEPERPLMAQVSLATALALPLSHV